MYKTTVPLAIRMNDPVFAEAVMRGLAVSWRELRVRCETPGAPAASVPGDPPAAVLTDEESFAESSARYPAVPVFVIGEPFESERKDVLFLSRFAGAREIGAEILAELGWEKRTGGTNPAFCVFLTSASGGTGLSSVSTALARVLRSIRGGPVLYLSCEPYPSGWRLLRGSDNGRTLEEYVFRLALPNGRVFPEGYLREDVGGVRYFASNGSYNELLTMEEGDAETFFGELSAAFAGGTIVFDAPQPPPARLDFALSAAEVLVTVGDGTAESEKRNAALEERIGESYAFRKTVRVVNETRPGRMIGAVIGAEDVVLPYDPISMEPDGIRLERAFGSGVRELAETIERIRYGEPDGTDGGTDRRFRSAENGRRAFSGLR